MTSLERDAGARTSEPNRRNASMRILIVEDNAKLAAAIARALVEQGHAVDLAHTAAAAEEHLGDGSHDLVILDLMLPDKDGVQLVRELRRRKIATPVLVLTALSASDEKVAALDAGADDYVTKPFDLGELSARMRALLRRHEGSEASVLRCSDLELDLRRRVATRAGHQVPLSNREFALLELLMRNEGRVIGRSHITERIWDMNHEPESNVVEVYISALRRKLERGFEGKLIHTVVGVGYRFGFVSDNGS